MTGQELYEKYLNIWREVEPNVHPEWWGLQPITREVWNKLAWSIGGSQ